MNIGETIRIITVEPARVPVPQREPAERPLRKLPVRPTPSEPAKTPTKVPQKS